MNYFINLNANFWCFVWSWKDQNRCWAFPHKKNPSSCIKVNSIEYNCDTNFWLTCYYLSEENVTHFLLQTKAEEESKQLRNQLQAMTEQLNQSETVQRDFVRLSQSLQVIGQITVNKEQWFWCSADFLLYPVACFCFSSASLRINHCIIFHSVVLISLSMMRENCFWLIF